MTTQKAQKNRTTHPRHRRAECSGSMSRSMASPLLCLAMVLAVLRGDAAEQTVDRAPLYFYTSVGDNLWVPTHLQTDSAESIDALIERHVRTYGITGIYWRDLGWFVNRFKFGKETAMVHDWVTWCQQQSKDNALADAAIRSARKHGVKIFMHTGLFESGMQPDVGIISPYLFENPLRIEHPEWLSIDRWGELRCPGTIAFCYPNARKATIDALVKHIVDRGYDGVNFYTYVENYGVSYFEQFGYNQPIIDAFQKRYPAVDPRMGILTGEHKAYLARCRGEFLTLFLKELKERLDVEGKTMSVELDPVNLNLPSPWPPKPFPVVGNVYVDYDQWIKDGIVDGLCIPEAAVSSKKVQKVLEGLTKTYNDYDVTFTFKTGQPFLSGWSPLRRKYGVVPAFKKCYAASKYVKHHVGSGMLFSDNWLERAQSLKDITSKKLPFREEYLPQMTTLAADTNVLVRREAMFALAATERPQCIPVIERGLFDSQPSVRIGAALALGSLNNDVTPAIMFRALETNHYFQFKWACVHSLKTMDRPKQLACINSMLESPQDALKEVAINALRILSVKLPSNRVIPLLCKTVMNPNESELVRFYAARELYYVAVTKRAQSVSTEQKQMVTGTYMKIIDDENVSKTVLYKALRYIRHLLTAMPQDQQTKLFTRLSTMFRSYGDNSTQTDSAYGWRVIGNTMLSFDNTATIEFERYLGQKDDKWLAWLAYRMLYDKLSNHWKENLITEEEAVRRHTFAPEFPGYRTWNN